MRGGWWMLAAWLGACARDRPVVVSARAYAMPFCTRTLGVAECFADPKALLDRPMPLGDMPVRLHQQPAPYWPVLDQGVAPTVSAWAPPASR